MAQAPSAAKSKNAPITENAAAEACKSCNDGKAMLELSPLDAALSYAGRGWRVCPLYHAVGEKMLVREGRLW